MTSKRRREGLERELELAEAEYEERLTDALRACASGHVGLFGAYDAAAMRGYDRLLSKGSKDLRERAEAIAELRARLGYAEPFALHQRYLEIRKSALDPNSPGEPKLAAAFLAQLSTAAGGTTLD